MAASPTRTIFFRLPEIDAALAAEQAASEELSTPMYVRNMLLERLHPKSGHDVDQIGHSEAAAGGDRTRRAEILTLEEAAYLLRVTPVDLRMSLDAGLVPGRVFNGQWRILRRALLRWLASQG
jgi:hypothetical protein